MADRKFAAAALLAALAIACGESEPTQAPVDPEFAALMARAEGGDPAAQVAVADRFESDDARPGADAEALKWYRKAALQNHAEGQYSLGVMIFGGRGQREDEVEGAKWIRKAAEAGYADAQNSLAVLYATGSGVELDHEASMEWFRKAAELGHPTAQLSLGTRLAQGFLGPEDPEAAAVWFRRAAEGGLPAAQWRYGIALSHGDGVPKDDREAYFWLTLSGVARTTESIDEVESVGAKLSEEERATELKSMTEWAREHLGP